MEQLADDLWVADAPLRFLGLEVGTRMTAIRLPDGRLMLISPVPAEPALVERVGALGSVAFLVAPNRFHHLYVAEWKTACPEAAVYAAPGLDEKRPDLATAGVLSDAAEPGWSSVVEQQVMAGFPLTNEVVFFHRPSATLIATDLAFHVGAESPAPTRFAFRLLGAYGRLAPSILERLLIRDRAAFRRCLDRVLAFLLSSASSSVPSGLLTRPCRHRSPESRHQGNLDRVSSRHSWLGVPTL